MPQVKRPAAPTAAFFAVGTKPADATTKKGDTAPIQVKQKNKVGRPDLDAFEAAMTRDDRPGSVLGLAAALGLPVFEYADQLCGVDVAAGDDADDCARAGLA